MLRNYLKTAWRHLRKNKVYSFINILGLSAGLACCMLISLYLYNELNYDAYQKNLRDLYQVGTVFTFQHKESSWATTPAPMGEAMKREFPEVQECTRLFGLLSEDKTLIQYYAPGGALMKSLYESNGFLADATFFRMFTYDFIEGDPGTALVNPSTIVISEDIATKIFGQEPALNKIIHVSSTSNGDHDLTVTGVFRPVNAPTHINGHFFMSMFGGAVGDHVTEKANDFATDNMYFTYLQLKPGADAKKLEQKFPAFIEKHAARDLKALGFDKRQFLTPVRDIHLLSGIQNNVSPAGSRTYLYILSSIAVFTLVIACINFMNLATARSSKRSAEVGMRKVLGANKRLLIGQFLGESIIMSFIAFVFACAITLSMTPLFGRMTGSPFPLSLTRHLWLMGAFLGLALLTGLLSGSYPAFYLSSFNPVRVLKGKFTNSLAAIALRKGLVVFQFIISVGLIISSIVINDQMQYMRSKDLGFDKTGQVVVPLRSQTAKDIYPAMRAELSRNAQIASVGAGYYYPGITTLSEIQFYRPGENVEASKRIHTNYVDVGFLQTLGIEPVAGRLFSPAFMSDSTDGVILNETAIRTLGYSTPQEAVGQRLYNDWQGTTTTYQIVGVVRNFHFEDLHLSIAPYGFFLSRQPRYNYMVVHARTIGGAGLQNVIAPVWHSLNPNEPFEYSYLDDDFQKNYRMEERLSAMIRYFTILAIIISCLGLFGLASFNIEQRIKEIGIRKVLGASVSSIIILVSKEFLKLVSIAFLIASPFAWYIMHGWLQDFAYRTNISWTIFFLSFLMAISITLFTIGFQAWKAALANPVKSIKTE